MADREATELERLVAEVVRAVLAESQAAAAPVATSPVAAAGFAPRQGDSASPERLFSTTPNPRTSALPGIARLAREAALEALTRASPARLGVGRAGLRYPTQTYLQLRGDHAVAKDAVVSEPTPEFLASLGAVELRSQAADLQTFLLQPDMGRVLDEASVQKLRAEATRGADVQVILADGLSAWAAERNVGLLPALQRELAAAGFSVGKPIWVHRARIAVADQIGVELGAKATLICLGERPGLGTGDSLSIYLAWNPAIGQDNADKNCISNVRPAGFSVDEAARQAVVLLKKSREIGRGGLALGAADAPGSKP
ncbi:MAG: ethanolamine ammonia-lyase subunit EutC [Myxococcota bacterium]